MTSIAQKLLSQRNSARNSGPKIKKKIPTKKTVLTTRWSRNEKAKKRVRQLHSRLIAGFGADSISPGQKKKRFMLNSPRMKRKPHKLPALSNKREVNKLSGSGSGSTFMVSEKTSPNTSLNLRKLVRKPELYRCGDRKIKILSEQKGFRYDGGLEFGDEVLSRLKVLGKDKERGERKRLKEGRQRADADLQRDRNRESMKKLGYWNKAEYGRTKRKKSDQVSFEERKTLDKKSGSPRKGQLAVKLTREVRKSRIEIKERDVLAEHESQEIQNQNLLNIESYKERRENNFSKNQILQKSRLQTLIDPTSSKHNKTKNKEREKLGNEDSDHYKLKEKDFIDQQTSLALKNQSNRTKAGKGSLFSLRNNKKRVCNRSLESLLTRPKSSLSQLKKIKKGNLSGRDRGDRSMPWRSRDRENLPGYLPISRNKKEFHNLPKSRGNLTTKRHKQSKKRSKLPNFPSQAKLKHEDKKLPDKFEISQESPSFQNTQTRTHTKSFNPPGRNPKSHFRTQQQENLSETPTPNIRKRVSNPKKSENFLKSQNSVKSKNFAFKPERIRGTDNLGKLAPSALLVRPPQILSFAQSKESQKKRLEQGKARALEKIKNKDLGSLGLKKIRELSLSDEKAGKRRKKAIVGKVGSRVGNSGSLEGSQRRRLNKKGFKGGFGLVKGGKGKMIGSVSGDYVRMNVDKKKKLTVRIIFFLFLRLDKIIMLILIS